MPDARAFSPNMVSPQHVAQAAQARPGGVTLAFRVSVHGSLEECAHRARSFQQSFTSMRARARGLSQKRLGESTSPRYSMARGPYDDLVCQRRLLPNGEGWAVDIIPSNLTLTSLDIIDRETGLPVDTVDNNSNLIFTLSTKYSNYLMGKGPSLTMDEEETLKRVAGEDALEEIRSYSSGASLDAPGNVGEVITPQARRSSDPNDMTEEEMDAWANRK